MKRILIFILCFVAAVIAESEWSCKVMEYNGDQIVKVDYGTSVEEIFYDAIGRKTKSVFLGDTVLYEYDAKGNLSKIVSNGIVNSSYEYYNDGKIKTIFDSEGDVTDTYKYDGDTVYEYSSNGTTTISKYENGNLVYVENNKGYTSTFEYDKKGRLIFSQDSEGTKEVHKYTERSGKTVMDCTLVYFPD